MPEKQKVTLIGTGMKTLGIQVQSKPKITAAMRRMAGKWKLTLTEDGNLKLTKFMNLPLIGGVDSSEIGRPGDWLVMSKSNNGLDDEPKLLDAKYVSCAQV